jgi:hypothetical protein
MATVQHAISEEELLEITMGYEDRTPVTFSEFVSTFVTGPTSQHATTITDENGDHSDPRRSDLTAAGVFLRSLAEAGYVIAKKDVLDALAQANMDDPRLTSTRSQ